MQRIRKTLPVRTPSHACLVNVTPQVKELVHQSGIHQGSCLLYNPHTTAGLTINEQADPDVVTDILQGLERFVPWRAGYHHSEGNAAAHIKASLLGSSLTVLIENGDLLLGTWQGIFFCEFDGPRSRRLEVRLLSES